jgi:carbon monoxide dehydrogenase subunit G
MQAALLLWRAPMKPWLPYPFATVPRLMTMISVALTLAGCGGTATPMAPSVVEQLPSDVSRANNPEALLTTRRAVNTFPLVNGAFALTLSTSDGSVGTVTGTYAGEAVVSDHGSQTATLTLQITGTSGIGSTITAIEADGTRAFVGEGDFALSLLLTSSLTKSPLRVTVRGTSQVSCSASHRILVSLHGTDSTRGFLEITADLQHQVESGAGC